MFKKKIVSAGDIVLLAVLLTAAVLLISSIPGQKDITGTYCSGEEVSTDCVYITFYRNDSFLIYRQHSTGISGRFTAEDAGDGSVLELELSDGTLLAAVFDERDTITFADEFIEDIPCPVEFSRISETPMEINVQKRN